MGDKTTKTTKKTGSTTPSQPTTPSTHSAKAKHSNPASTSSTTQPATSSTTEQTTPPQTSAPSATNTDLDSTTTITNPDSNSATEKSTIPRKPHTALKVIIFLLIIVIFFACIIILWIMGNSLSHPTNSPSVDRVDFPDPVYSNLTGEEIADESLNSSPTFCVQIPNGLDGARPQAGLTQAAIVFEAIAEAGITRFAAIFQNPTVSAIGPIRSLRPYYLNWDAPFDCTIVHAGGSDEALAALRYGDYRDLDENNTYMWREYSNRGWNNLFSSSNDLLAFNKNSDYKTSNPKTFPRLTPDEVDLIVTRNLNALSEDCGDNHNDSCSTMIVSNIAIDFGISPLFNTYYTYDVTTNKYTRFFATGDPHLTYECPSDLYHPDTTADCGNPVPITPSVVIAMVVSENRMADGYHENIQTNGSGTATIFQNGEVIEGSWTKNSTTEQIVFRDATGNIIKITPGQTWISAVPQYGGVDYELVLLEGGNN